MICGFERGDIQVFEIMKKWNRISHIPQCHKSKIIKVEFFNYQDGKVESYEALSVDDQGIIFD